LKLKKGEHGFAHQGDKSRAMNTSLRRWSSPSATHITSALSPLRKGLHTADADEALQIIAGQYLVALGYDEEDNLSVLAFSPDPEDMEGEEFVPVPMDSARQLGCPGEQRQRRIRNRPR
jgi:hypothetical protein